VTIVGRLKRRSHSRPGRRGADHGDIRNRPRRAETRTQLAAAAPWNFPEPFGGRAIGAGNGRAGILAPDQFGRVRVPGEKRATCCALRSDDTEAIESDNRSLVDGDKQTGSH
jgi:hypothetical protein